MKPRKSVLGYFGSVFGLKTSDTNTTPPKVEEKPISREDFHSDEQYQLFLQLKEQWETFLKEASLYSETDTAIYSIITLFHKVFYNQNMFQHHFHQM